MAEETGKDKALTKDVLVHALAFRGNSARVYHNAVTEVKQLTSQSDYLYSPKNFPRIRNPYPESTIRLTPESDFDGRLSQAEAAALVVLLSECSALAQAFARDWETTRKLQEVLKLPEGGWSPDAIDGLAEFGDILGLAAGVRDRIISDEGPPVVKTLGGKVKKGWWDRFEEPVRQDEMVLGSHTAEAIVRTIGKFAERDIPNNPEGAKTEKEVKARIASKKRGARLAANLYLEVWELVSKELPSKIEARAVQKAKPLQLPGK